MDRHDDLCVCFHVPLQKVEKFVRLNDPKHASQISECYGAGTGCGWCIPFLEKVFEDHKAGKPTDLKMSREEYLNRRKTYRQTGESKNRFSG
ncbi:MAG: (2Fe-2S)-binding protein [Candidatus Omnitrophica bacterium]|nr:(2Fe-2S)-binding protein [Candidatus Omnitrophota bacterium]